MNGCGLKLRAGPCLNAVCLVRVVVELDRGVAVAGVLKIVPRAALRASGPAERAGVAVVACYVVLTTQC